METSKSASGFVIAAWICTCRRLRLDANWKAALAWSLVTCWPAKGNSLFWLLRALVWIGEQTESDWVIGGQRRANLKQQARRLWRWDRDLARASSRTDWRRGRHLRQEMRAELMKTRPAKQSIQSLQSNQSSWLHWLDIQINERSRRLAFWGRAIRGRPGG